MLNKGYKSSHTVLGTELAFNNGTYFNDNTIIFQILICSEGETSSPKGEDKAECLVPSGGQKKEAPLYPAVH